MLWKQTEISVRLKLSRCTLTNILIAYPKLNSPRRRVPRAYPLAFETSDLQGQLLTLRDREGQVGNRAAGLGIPILVQK